MLDLIWCCFLQVENLSKMFDLKPPPGARVLFGEVWNKIFLILLQVRQSISRAGELLWLARTALHGETFAYSWILSCEVSIFGGVYPKRHKLWFIYRCRNFVEATKLAEDLVGVSPRSNSSSLWIINVLHSSPGHIWRTRPHFSTLHKPSKPQEYILFPETYEHGMLTVSNLIIVSPNIWHSMDVWGSSNLL